MAFMMTWEQRQDLGRRLDMDPVDVTAEGLAAKLRDLRQRADRAAERSFADSDSTGILRLTEMPAEKPVTRTTKTPVGYTDVLAAKADGRIEPSEGPVWLKRFEDDEPFARELLNALRPDPVRAKAFEDNPEIRSLGDQLDSYLGVAEEDRVQRNFGEESLPDSEQAYRRMLRDTGLPGGF